MNGQLSEQPLAELIREISSRSLSGRLRLEHERIQVVAYFELGKFLYAASNARTLRIREYLKKAEAVSDQDLAQFNERMTDTDLLKVLCAQKLLSPPVAEQVQTRQVADVLRLALLWTDGAWDFESRSRLGEQLNPQIDVDALLLEAARRLPPKFAASRFGNTDEIITPVAEPLVNDNLLPAEVFLLSRVDRPTTVRELVAVSGLGHDETIQTGKYKFRFKSTPHLPHGFPRLEQCEVSEHFRGVVVAARGIGIAGAHDDFQQLKTRLAFFIRRPRIRHIRKMHAVIPRQAFVKHTAQTENIAPRLARALRCHESLRAHDGA